jgi:TPR repeat protein
MERLLASGYRPSLLRHWPLAFLMLLACGGATPMAQPPPQALTAAQPAARPPTTTRQEPPPPKPKPARISITADMPPALRDYIASADRECDKGVEYACRYNVKSYFETADQQCEAAKPRECYGLAEMYRKGDSIDPNPTRAAELHEKGCAQGDAHSCFIAAGMNDEGAGIPINDVHAAALYEKGCKGGERKACDNASIMYFTGEGVAKDLHRSTELAGRACELGLVKGCGQLGMQLSLGQGVKKDLQRAVKLLTQACDDNDGGGCQGLARLYHLGEGVKKDEARTLELLNRACQLGIKQACTVGAPAFAGPKQTKEKDIHQCHVVNSTDHEIGHGGVYPGETWWILDGTFKIYDGNATLEIACVPNSPVLNLKGPRGKVTIERLPAWFAFRADTDAETITIEATGKDASVEIDGKPLGLTKGVAKVPFDTRTRLLATDPAVAFTTPWRGWRVQAQLKASSDGQTVELPILLDVSKAARALSEELRAADKQPVAWAAAPDHAGPTVLIDRVSSWRTHGVMTYTRCGFGDFVPLRDVSSLSAVSLVAICEASNAKVDTCPKSNDKFAANEPPVERYRRQATIQLLEAQTSKVVATTTLNGKDPAPCRDSAANAIVGEDVSKADVLAWLRTVK